MPSKISDREFVIIATISGVASVKILVILLNKVLIAANIMTSGVIKLFGVVAAVIAVRYGFYVFGMRLEFLQ